MTRDELDKEQFSVNEERERLIQCSSMASGKPEEMRQRSEPLGGALQFFFFAEVEPRGQRQLAAKYTREGDCHANKVGKSNQKWCRKVVQIWTTYFLKRFLNSKKTLHE